MIYNRRFVCVYTRRSLPIQVHRVSNHDGCPMVAGCFSHSPILNDEFPARQDATEKLGMRMVWACVCGCRTMDLEHGVSEASSQRQSVKAAMSQCSCRAVLASAELTWHWTLRCAGPMTL